MSSAVNAITGMYRGSAADMKVKVKTSNMRHPAQPGWWDNPCNTAKRNKYCLLRRCRRLNDDNILSVYKRARSSFKVLCRSKRSEYEKVKREELLQATSNPKAFWGLLKRSNLKPSMENRITPSQWVEYFHSLLFKESEQCITDMKVNIEIEQNNTSEYDILNSPIRNQEIDKSIQCLKSGKSHGIDGIRAEFYKCSSAAITPVLNILFNKILASGNFLDSWSDSLIVPIYRFSSRNEPSNYRVISLINVMYKIFSKIINDRLYAWTEDQDIIDDSQAGFRDGYSVMDNVFSLQNRVQKYISRPEGGGDSTFYLYTFRRRLAA